MFLWVCYFQADLNRHLLAGLDSQSIVFCFLSKTKVEIRALKLFFFFLMWKEVMKLSLFSGYKLYIYKIQTIQQKKAKVAGY